MADAPETIITVKADTKPAEGSVEGLWSRFRGLATDINAGFELAGKAVQAFSAVVNTALDFAQAGEEIAAIGTRFEILAGQAGLVPQSIADGISSAVQGTVDMEEALQSASGALITLEAGAQRIPEMFDLAKRATSLFGGEVTDRFEQITMAVATGSTRMLRSMGLIIDSDKVFKEYAKTVGTTADKLSTAERQQAMLNAVLEKGQTQFKNIDGSITPITTSLKKQAVAVGELGDTFKTLFNNVFGTILVKNINSATSALDVLNIKLGEFLLGKTPSITEQMKLLNYELDELAKKRDIAAARGDIGRMEQIQIETTAIQEQLMIQQQLLFQKQTQEAIEAKEIERKQKLIDATNRDTAAKLSNASAIKTQADSGNYALKIFEDYLASFEQDLKNLNVGLKNTFVTGFSTAFAAMGQAIVQGQDAFGAFGRSILMMLGNVAIQMGSFFIMMGTGLLFINPAQGVGLIAAGAGLSLLGGILQALGSGAGQQQSAAGGGAGIAAGGAPTNPIYTSPMSQETIEQERAKAQTGVQVIVQGNIFDNRETGLQIAQIINDSFDLEGTLIRATV